MGPPSSRGKPWNLGFGPVTFPDFEMATRWWFVHDEVMVGTLFMFSRNCKKYWCFPLNLRSLFSPTFYIAGCLFSVPLSLPVLDRCTTAWSRSSRTSTARTRATWETRGASRLTSRATSRVSSYSWRRSRRRATRTRYVSPLLFSTTYLQPVSVLVSVLVLTSVFNNVIFVGGVSPATC